MLSRIESALNDSKSKPHTQRSRELLAYEMSFEPNPYSVQYVEGGGDEGWEVVDTSAVADYNAYDTNCYNPDFPEAAEQETQYYDCGEVPEGEGDVGDEHGYYDAHDNPDIPTPLDNHEYQAF